MGLNITAYSRLTKQEIRPDSTDERSDDYFWCRINSDFPGRADDVEDGAAYSYEDSFGFSAGSYGGYGDWRDELAELGGYPPDPTEKKRQHAAGAWKSSKGPFWELINFADHDGVIGALISVKLAKDFAEFQSKADRIGGWFLDRYKLWRKAFELASDRGAVHFH